MNNDSGWIGMGLLILPIAIAAFCTGILCLVVAVMM